MNRRHGPRKIVGGKTKGRPTTSGLESSFLRTICKSFKEFEVDLDGWLSGSVHVCKAKGEASTMFGSTSTTYQCPVP